MTKQFPLMKNLQSAKHVGVYKEVTSQFHGVLCTNLRKETNSVGLCLWSSTKNVRESGYWGYGE